MKQLLFSILLVCSYAGSFANNNETNTFRQIKSDYIEYDKKLKDTKAAYDKELGYTKAKYFGIGGGAGLAFGIFTGAVAVLSRRPKKIKERSTHSSNATVIQLR